MFGTLLNSLKTFSVFLYDNETMKINALEEKVESALICHTKLDLFVGSYKEM